MSVIEERKGGEQGKGESSESEALSERTWLFEGFQVLLRRFSSFQIHLKTGNEKSTKIGFWGLETIWWGWDLPWEGVGIEKFAPSLETKQNTTDFFWDIPAILLRMSRTACGCSNTIKFLILHPKEYSEIF